MNRRFFAKKLASLAAAMGLGGAVKAASGSTVDERAKKEVPPPHKGWPSGAKKMLLGVETEAKVGSPGTMTVRLKYLMRDSTIQVDSYSTSKPICWDDLDFGTYYY